MKRGLWTGLVMGVLCGSVLLTGLFGGGISAIVDADESGPLADAGLDQTVREGSTVHLDAGGSTAPDGSIESYEWQIETPAGESVDPECVSCVQTTFVATEPGTYTVSVDVTDSEDRTDTDTLYVEVEPYDPPELTVDGPDEVSVGAERTLTAEAVATEKPLSSLTWFHDGNHHADTHLSGEQTIVHETSVTFDEPGVHELNATVSDVLGYQTSNGTAVRVTTPYPYLVVTITDIDSPVSEGESLVVEAFVENVGEQRANEPVWLTRDGAIVDSHNEVSVMPGEQENVTFTWKTNVGDAGEYTLTTHSVNDTDSGPAVVESTGENGEANFEVEYETTPDKEVPPGETVAPVVRVENTGSVTAEQAVTLVDIHGYPAESAHVKLEPGESRTLSTLSWVPTESDVGSGDLRVETEDDHDETPLTVLEPAEFEVAIQDVTEFGLEDGLSENMTATVQITNTGEHEETQPVTLSTEFNETDDATPGVLDDTTITLDGGEETTTELTWADAAVALSGVSLEQDDLEDVDGTYTGILEWYDERINGSVKIYDGEIVAQTDDDADTATVTPEVPPIDEDNPSTIPEIPDIDLTGLKKPTAADIDTGLELRGELGEVDVDMVLPEGLEDAPWADDFEAIDLDPAVHEMSVITENGEEIEVGEDGEFDLSKTNSDIESFEMEAGETVDSDVNWFIEMEEGEHFEDPQDNDDDDEDERDRPGDGPPGDDPPGDGPVDDPGECTNPPCPYSESPPLELWDTISSIPENIQKEDSAVKISDD